MLSRDKQETMPVWAIIPLKSPDSAKSRLSGALTAQQRLRLFYALAGRVIEAAVRTPGIAGVTVVTASDAVMEFAANLGAQRLRLESDRGMAAACRDTLEKLPARVLQRVLFIAGDLPLISSSALLPMVTLSDRSPLVAIAADRRHFGTNALLCAPGHAIPLYFGSGSFTQHLAAAARLGVATHIVDSAALALDIDEPGDLHEWRRRLAESGQPVDVELTDLFAIQEVAFGQ